MRLIDADHFRSVMWYTFGEQDDHFNKGMAKWDSGLWVRYKAVEEVLDSQPTIESEPIVRCEDCVFGCAYNEKWYMPRRDGWWCCREEKEVDTDDFCSRGARWKNEN